MRLGAAAEYLGLVAAVLAWIVIGVCVLTNPWFVFTRNAFSDLGGPYSTDPWLYNDGLILVALLIFLYAIYLARLGANKVEVVSAWFFVQFDIAIFTSGIGLLLRGLRAMAYGVLSLFLIATLVAALVPWPSAATIEAWGISAIDVWAILVFTSYRSKPKKSSDE